MAKFLQGCYKEPRRVSSFKAKYGWCILPRLFLGKGMLAACKQLSKA
ncbi:hypothetical protein NPIL_73691, partial [Nephila pilipes]